MTNHRVTHWWLRKGGPANRPAEAPFTDSSPLKVQVTHLI